MAVVTVTAPAVAAATASASASSSREQDLKCEVLISDFVGIEKPNVKEMQEFAQCVERIHPTQEQNQSLKGGVQIILMVSVIAFVAGFIWSRWVASGKLFNYWFDDVMHGALCVVTSWLILSVTFIFLWAFS